MRKALSGEWKEWEVKVKIPSKLTKKEKAFIEWINEQLDKRDKRTKKGLGKKIWPIKS